MATRVTYIPFMRASLANLKKEHHIGEMATLLSLITWSITPNDCTIQPSNISFGGTHHSLSQKIAKDQDLMVYRLEIK